MADHYSVLRVNKSASQKQIETSFKELALKFHPDKNPSADPSIFLEINSAGEILRDPFKRAEYDNRGFQDWIHCETPPTEREVLVSLKELYFGENMSAQVTTMQDDMPVTETVNFHISRGARDGMKIRVWGRGNKEKGKNRGDLFFIIKSTHHQQFKREGDNLILEMHIQFQLALFDFPLCLQMINEKEEEIIIPAQTSVRNPRHSFVVKGLGMPKYHSKNECGDLVIKFKYSAPKNKLSEMEENAILSLLDNVDVEERICERVSNSVYHYDCHYFENLEAFFLFCFFTFAFYSVTLFHISEYISN